MQLFKPIQILLRNAVTAYYRVILRPSNDFDKDILYKMVWDRRPILTILNEKVASRQYVLNVTPRVALAHRYYETKDISAIDWTSLPRNFVIKASHGSGGVLLVHEGAPLENKFPANYKKFGWRRLEIHPDNFDKDIAVKIFSELMNKTYGQGLNRGGPEWAYWHNEPHVIIEEFLSHQGQMPVSLVFNIVHGEIKLVIWAQVFYQDLGVATSQSTRTVEPPLDIAALSEELNISLQKTEEMIDDSLLIAGDMDFLRVDWLISKGEAFFNELTNYPGAGLLKGRGYYKAMSDMWHPNRLDYRQENHGEAPKSAGG